MDKNTEEFLLQKIEELEQKNKDLLEGKEFDIEMEKPETISNTKDFLYLLSHKIITPMNSIIGMSNFLKDTPLDNEQQKMVSGIRNSSLSIINIYNEILNFVDVETSNKSKIESEFNINDVLDKAIDSFYQNIFRKKNIKINTHFDSDIPQNFISDAKTIEQIIFLALGEPDNNDIKKVIDISISVDYIYEDTQLIISITHRDVSLNDQYIQHLSQNKLSQKNTLDAGNNFFKFIFAKKITELNGGTFTPRKTGDNISLIIVIPVNISITQDNVLPSPIIPEFRGIKALIASENIAHRTIIKQHLQTWGVRSIVADNEEELLNLLITDRKINFALISDKIPVNDLRTLGKKITSLPGKSNFPLILIQSQRHIIIPDGIFIDTIKTPEDQIIIFEMLIKNIEEGRIKSDNSNLLDDKLAKKIPLEILVVEDDETNLDLMLLLLKKLGYKADTSIDGREAVQKAKDKEYDMIFMDIQLPRLNGYSASKYIFANNTSEKKPKIIAISANHTSEIKAEAQKAGMIDFITKPISFLKVEETIIKWGYLYLNKKN